MNLDQMFQSFLRRNFLVNEFTSSFLQLRAWTNHTSSLVGHMGSSKTYVFEIREKVRINNEKKKQVCVERKSFYVTSIVDDDVSESIANLVPSSGVSIGGHPGLVLGIVPLFRKKKWNKIKLKQKRKWIKINNLHHLDVAIAKRKPKQLFPSSCNCLFKKNRFESKIFRKYFLHQIIVSRIQIDWNVGENQWQQDFTWSCKILFFVEKKKKSKKKKKKFGFYVNKSKVWIGCTCLPSWRCCCIELLHNL